MSSDWSEVTLGDLCVQDKQQGRHEGLPFVGLEDIESATGRFLGKLRPRSTKSTTFRFTAHHLLYGRLRPYLNKTLSPDFDGHCSTEIFPLLPKPGVERRFLQYWLMSAQTVSKFNATWTGARMPRANVDQAMSFKLMAPCFNEQARIVGILDQALSELSIVRAQVETSLRLSYESFEANRDALLAPRENWRTGSLEAVCEIRHGFAFQGEFFKSEGPYVLLTPGNFFERGGYRDRSEKQKFYDGPIPTGFVLPPGALLVAMTEQAAGLLGSSLLVPEQGDFLHNQRLGLVVPKGDAPWNNRFFFHLFNTPAVRRAVHSSSSGVKVRHTSPNKIGEINVSIPKTTAEQEEIANRLDRHHDAAEELEVILQQKFIALEELKQSLLHQAFSGNL